MQTSKIELFATILNSWQPLTINYCLKESPLKCDRVPKCAFDNKTTVATFLRQDTFFLGMLNVKLNVNKTKCQRLNLLWVGDTL